MELLIGAAVLFIIYKVFIERKRDEPKEIPVKLVITTEYRTEGRRDGSEQTDSDRDNWEGAFWDVPSQRSAEANLRIGYRDGAGAVTTRDIRVMKYGPWEGGAMLWAYCHMRQANRTFRTDRITSCTDLDSGEIINDLQAWLDAKYQSSPDAAIEKIIDEAWDALRVLYYVCKADGRLTQKERAVVREAVRSLSDRPAIDDRRIDEMFDLIDNTTIGGFKQTFGRIVKHNRELAAKVVSWCESIVATEKSVAASEQEAIDYLRVRLAK